MNLVAITFVIIFIPVYYINMVMQKSVRIDVILIYYFIAVWLSMFFRVPSLNPEWYQRTITVYGTSAGRGKIPTILACCRGLL